MRVISAQDPLRALPFESDLGPLVSRLVTLHGKTRTAEALRRFARSLRAPKTVHPWEQPVGGSFIFPWKGTRRLTQESATARCAARWHAAGEKWSTRGTVIDGKECVVVTRTK